LELVEDAIIGAMRRPLIRHSFFSTRLFPLLPDVVLKTVPHSGPERLTKRKIRINISGKFVTDSEFLREWKYIEEGEKEREVEGEEEEEVKSEDSLVVSDSDMLPEELECRKTPENVNLVVHRKFENEEKDGEAPSLGEKCKLFTEKKEVEKALLAEAEKITDKKKSSYGKSVGE
jgi:hypothetical protein